jgi:2-polyprenyl-6-methoxyphenol hydroxylase-like FAD-dependent oxidoreductase
MSRPLAALVVGGGVGGLAAGLALRRAGLRVTVLERADSLREVGAGLALSPNACRALAWLGLAGEAERLGAPAELVTIVREDGRVLNRGTIDLRRMFGAPTLCLRRGDLLAVLAEALGEDALVLGAGVRGVEGDGAGVAAVLDSGIRIAGDLLVGADGLRSVVRRQLAGGEPRYSGALAWRAVARGRFGSGLAVGRGAHAGWLPLTGGETYWFACVNAAEGTQPPAEGVAAELRARFGRWASPLPALLAGTAAAGVLRHDLYEHGPPGRTWGTGRVTLLGDAAHAMTPGLGQGACAALEDAVVLSRCVGEGLRDGGSPVPALRAYERARRARVARLQRQSAVALRMLQPRGRLGSPLRDAVLRLPASWAARGQRWVYAYDPSAG